MNIIIIDEDLNFREDLAKYLTYNGCMNVIEVFNNSDEAVNFIDENYKILELIIFDLEMSTLNVNNIIDNIPQNCNAIGFYKTTKTLNEYINNPYLQRVFKKPVSGSTVLNYINIQNGIESLEVAKKNTLRNLSNIGFNINHSGTMYLVETIVLAKRNKIKKLSDIYTLIAYNHHTEPRIIGWSINNAINKVIKSHSAEDLCNFFEIDDIKKLTAKYIVNYVMNYHDKITN